MKQINKYVVPVNVIVFGEDEKDAITYVEEALDNCSFINEDGIIGAEVMLDDIEDFVQTTWEEEDNDDDTDNQSD